MADMTIRKRVEVGQQFGRLTVIEPTESKVIKNGQKCRQWLCRCNCGVHTIVISRSLITGNTRSCGCLQRESASVNNVKHGHSYSSTYRAWTNMKRRCTNAKSKTWSRYGGRGICVCDAWMEKFENFLADMGVKPPGLTLGRKDNNGPYTPDNCCWETRYEQQANTSRNVWVEYHGERMILSEAVRRSGLSFNVVYDRRRRGWTIDKALSTPLQKRRTRI
jgi:hypothetical protein